MIRTGICNGFGFDEESGPYFIVDKQDTHSIYWIRTHAPLRRTIIDIALLSQKYCTGYCKLSENVMLPCPQRKIISEKFKVCWNCFKLTGFNPAFYTLDKCELSTAQLQYNNRPHYVYLAAFGKDCFKVGMASHVRLFQRLTEQGARLATVVALLPDAYQARKMEETIQHVFLLPDRVTQKKKIKEITAYEKETTRQRLALWKHKIARKISIKGVFPYVYDLDNTYMSNNSPIGRSVTWTQLAFQNPIALKGHFYAMLGGFLFLKQPNQTLVALDIHKYVGKIRIQMDYID